MTGGMYLELMQLKVSGGACRARPLLQWEREARAQVVTA